MDTAEFHLFMSLPIELRCMIYSHYFRKPFDDWKSKYRLIQGSQYCNIFCLQKCHTEILIANHQVHYEAVDSLYRDTIWHFSFNSFKSKTAHETVDDTFLQELRSRPGFRLIRHVTIGVMFRPVMNASFRTLENRNRLTINRELLKKICKVLGRAPHLRTVKLLWHDSKDCGDWNKKKTCLRSLAKLPERVRCQIFLGKEAMAVHFHENPRPGLSTLEEQAKAKLNEYLKAVRQEYQANSQHKSPEGSENSST